MGKMCLKMVIWSYLLLAKMLFRKKKKTKKKQKTKKKKKKKRIKSLKMHVWKIIN